MVLLVGSARREARRGGAAGERVRGTARPIALGRAPPGARVSARRRMRRRGADERVPARQATSGDLRVDHAPGPQAARRGHLGCGLPATCRREPCSPGCRTSPRRRLPHPPATSRRWLAPRKQSSSRASCATRTANRGLHFTRGSTRFCRARRRSTRTRSRVSTTSASTYATTRRSISAAEPSAPCRRRRYRGRCAALAPDLTSAIARWAGLGPLPATTRAAP